MKNLDKVDKAVKIAEEKLGLKLEVKKTVRLNGEVAYSVFREGQKRGIIFPDLPAGTEEDAAELIIQIITKQDSLTPPCPTDDGEFEEKVSAAIKDGKMMPFLFSPKLNHELMENEDLAYWDVIPGHLALGLRVILDDDGEQITSMMLKNSNVDRESAPFDPVGLFNSIEEKIIDPMELLEAMMPEDAFGFMVDNGEVERVMMGVQGYMSVITSEKSHGLYGAAAALKPGVLHKVAEDMGIDVFYIIPSSRDEVMTCPISMDLREVRAMVEEVNRTNLALAQVLSEDVFVYSAESDTLYVAGKEDDPGLQYVIGTKLESSIA